MQMLTLIAYLAGGIILLYFGGYILVHASSKLAKGWGLTPLVTGLTVIALSTSMPELLGTLMAQLQGDYGSLAIGNIIGSNIANIGLILGISACITPMPVDRGMRRQEIPFTILSTILLWLFMLKNEIGRLEGAILVVCIISYKVFRIKKSHQTVVDKHHKRLPAKTQALQLTLVIVATLLLIYGAKILVEALLGLGTKFKIPHRVLGLTIFAIGTSLPELAASVTAAIHRQAHMAIGNVLGSNLLNILLIVGVVALIQPLTFGASFKTYDMPILFIFSILLWALSSNKSIGWIKGVVLLGCYAGYIVLIT